MNKPQPRPTLEKVTQVQANHAERLMHLPHVVGVAVGLREQDPDCYCIVVMVEHIPTHDELTPDEEWVPGELDGIPVEIRHTGAFFAGFSAGG